MKHGLCTAILFLTAATFVSDATAQGRGRFRPRPEEIDHRVAVHFQDAAAPATEDDKVADLETTELVRAASSSKQAAVLYLYRGGETEAREAFERELFGDEALAIKLRLFHCGRIDLDQHDALAQRYGKQAPLFVVFDADGKPGSPVSMAGYKASDKLEAQLDKAGKGLAKPSLDAFAKSYGNAVRDLEQALTKKQALEERLAKAGDDKQKRAEIDKDLAAAAAEEQKARDAERGLLERVRLVEPPAGAHRLGQRRGRGDRPDRGDQPGRGDRPDRGTPPDRRGG
jgi:hypothetical protein